MSSVGLQDLLAAGIDGHLVGVGEGADPQLRGVRHDSRQVESGDLFVVLRGEHFDGARFVDQAIERGAVAVLSDRPLDCGRPQLIVADTRIALPLAANIVYGRPFEQLAVVGVTGTNGKTTVVHLLEAALLGCGASPAVIGTTAFRGPGFEEPVSHTTPEGDELARYARRAVDVGATHLLMEVSSHALDQGRVDAIAFEVAAFTNLTQDHLDYHGDMERYFKAKERLFTELSPTHSVIPIDDVYGARLARVACGELLRCSRTQEADIQVVLSHFDRQGIDATVQTPAGEVRLKSPLVGEHNVDNLMVALGSLVALGVELETASEAMSHSQGAPGRLEAIANRADVMVVVDYAHTPDALARVLAALRAITPGRLIVAFGCGGDRDRVKRPKMGRAAADAADVMVVTSDNPRSEQPLAIIEEIVVALDGLASLSPSSLRDAGSGYLVEVDRQRAIGLAIAAARPGDTVLIAGKGHEDYQIIGSERRSFDDRVEARRALQAQGWI